MSFLDYDFTSTALEHKIIKKNNQYFNFPSHQINNNNRNEVSQYKNTPINSYNSSFHTPGGFLDFKFESILHLLFQNNIFTFELQENNTSINECINGSMMVDSVTLLEQGQIIMSYPGFYIWLKNNLNLDSLTYESIIMGQNGTLSTDFKKGISIAQNGKHKFFIELDTVLSNLALYRPKIKSEVVIRIQFRNGISVTSDSNLSFSNAYL